MPRTHVSPLTLFHSSVWHRVGKIERLTRYGASMTPRPTGRHRGRPPYPLLTPAEERVLKFIREGTTNPESGAGLGVSPDAVKYHVSNMLGKLQLENREQLAAWRESSGLSRVSAGLAGLGWMLALGGAAA